VLGALLSLSACHRPHHHMSIAHAHPLFNATKPPRQRRAALSLHCMVVGAARLLGAGARLAVGKGGGVDTMQMTQCMRIAQRANPLPSAACRPPPPQVAGYSSGALLAWPTRHRC
jgi:hypothetical protein